MRGLLKLTSFYIYHIIRTLVCGLAAYSGHEAFNLLEAKLRLLQIISGNIAFSGKHR